MLVLTLKPGQRLQVGDAVLWIMPDQGRFHVRIDADRSIPVRRIKDEAKNSEPDALPPSEPMKSSSTQEILRRMMAANKRK